MHAQHTRQRLRLCMSNSNSGDINVYANDGLGRAAAQRSTFGGCVGAVEQPEPRWLHAAWLRLQRAGKLQSLSQASEFIRHRLR